MGINMKPSKFPKQRRSDPKRRAEAAVFDALVNMGLVGCGIYEFRYRPDGQQVDYLIWLDHLGRVAGQVKGGEYRLDDEGGWQLRTYEGKWVSKPSPVQETVDGRIEMHDAIEKATGYYNFVAGVLFLPDMKRNLDMARLAWNRDHVCIVWGLDRLEKDFERIAERVGFRRPPEPAHSETSSGSYLTFSGKVGMRTGRRIRWQVRVGNRRRTSPGERSRVCTSSTPPSTFLTWSICTWSICTCTSPRWSRGCRPVVAARSVIPPPFRHRGSRPRLRYLSRGRSHRGAPSNTTTPGLREQPLQGDNHVQGETMPAVNPGDNYVHAKIRRRHPELDAAAAAVHRARGGSAAGSGWTGRGQDPLHRIAGVEPAAAGSGPP